MIDSMFQQGTDAALDDQVQRPKPEPATSPAFSLLGLGAAPFRGIGAGVSKSIAFGAEIVGAFGQVAGAYPEVFGGPLSEQQQKQAEAARLQLTKPGGGEDFSNEAGDTFRQRAADILPDPKTAHTSEQIVAGLFDYGTRAVGYSLTLGPLAPAAMGGDAGLEEADRLKQLGVDKATRTKAGAVAGVLNAAAVAAPLTGPTATIRAVKGVLAGEGSMVGQSLAERAIVRAAGYNKVADTFDPFDPVSLALGLVPGALGARFGHAAPRTVETGAPKPLQSMGLGERQALPFDDVRLDAYAVQAANREGIPPEILLAVKNAGEKSGSTATSPKGAQGVMQFMPDTFKKYGRGDPTDPMNSIDAGAKYLADLYKTYGDWDAALAHYNGGGRQAALVRAGKVAVPETAAYLQRVHDYIGGKITDDHVRAATAAEPDLEPAARVTQVADALDATRLTPADDIAGADAHLSAVELAADQMGRGEDVQVDDRVSRSFDESGDPWFRSYSEMTPADQAAFDKRHGIEPGRREEVAAAFARIDLQNLETQVHTASFGEDHYRAFSRNGETAAEFLRTADDQLAQARAKVADLEARAEAARRVTATADAAEQLRAARTPPEPRAPRETAPKPQATGTTGKEPPAKPSGGPQEPRSAGAEAQAPATIARAAAEAAMLNPDMLVHLEGMDVPMRVGDILAKAQDEAKQDTLMGKLVEVAAQCDLTA